MLGKGQAARWWAGATVGRSRDKATSVCNTRPKEGERWVTLTGPAVQTYTVHAFELTRTHSVGKSLPINKERIDFMKTRGSDAVFILLKAETDRKA